MFIAKKNEAYLKNFRDVKSGSFINDNGEVVEYDGYHQVTVSMFNKNNELVDIRCRIANGELGEKLYVALRNIPLMSKIYCDFEIQVPVKGSPKYFITAYEIAK